MTDNSIINTSPPAQVTQPRLLYGSWWPDYWSSPYVRGEFELPPGYHTLKLRLFSPVKHGATREVAVRLGHEPLTLIEFSEKASLVKWRYSWQGSIDRNETLSVSLRAGTLYSPGDHDKRKLGTLVQKWCVETRLTSFAAENLDATTDAKEKL